MSEQPSHDPSGWGPLPVDDAPLSNVKRHRWENIKAEKPLSSSLTFLGSKNVLIDGWIHLLASHAKTGKTTLLLYLVREWYAALGSECPQVLWLSEEGEHTWDYRRRVYDFSGLPINVVYGLSHDSSDLLVEACGGPEQIIFIDTASALMDMENENDNSGVTKIFKIWINGLRQFNKTAIFTHHLRKGGGGFGTAVAGATAWQRLVDVVLEINEVEDHPERRLVIPRSRVETPARFMYELMNRELIRMKTPEPHKAVTDHNPQWHRATAFEVIEGEKD